MRLLVLDGNSILNRAFYGVKPLTTKDGRYTNAIFGFLNILSRLREMTEPTHLVAAFDLSAPTFRHKLYDQYKAGRKHMPPELHQQLPVIKELLPLLGCAVVTCEGYEADDILGTLAYAAVAQGGECRIATGDRDSLQLVSDRVQVLLASTKMGQPDTSVYDVAAIDEKYGLLPSQLLDLKALMGDSSDNIPGVAGVGEKTALDLLHRFGSLDALYEQVAFADLRESVRQKLMAGKDSAYLSRTLGEICRTVPMDTDMAHYAVTPVQKEELARRLADLEFFKMLDKLGLTVPVETAPAGDLPDLMTVCDDAAAVLATATKAGKLYALYENDALWIGDGTRAAVLSDWSAALSTLCDEKVEKYTHDAKPLFAAMLRRDALPCGFTMDTALAAYLLNPLSSDYTLPRLCTVYGVPLPDGQPSVIALPALCAALRGPLSEQQQMTLLQDMELPLALVLADMENCGVDVDGAGIAAFGEQLQSEIDTLQQEIYAAVGYAFNLNSPKQLARALFEDLGLPAGKKTKSGYSTNADVLQKLRTAHPAVEMLLRYRTLAKLKSTYCDGLQKEIAADGRIHSSFNQTETRTGRISSAEPNLQNIPVRSPLGREMRRFFRARDGWVLIDADYSQIELRVLADMAGDPTMIHAFNNDLDIHRITASQVFGVPEELVTPLMRSRAKAVNFGIVYGIGAHSLSEDIDVSYGEAKQYIAEYLEHYGAVAGYMDGLIQKAKDCGYAETMFGRRRPLPELHAGNGITRGFGERVARNMPIQGTAADIIKMAMVRVFFRLRRERLRARLILQIHDELLVECPPEEAERVCALVSDEMEHAATLSVKLAVDAHTGRTWYDAKE